MSGFSQKWSGQQQTSFSDDIKESINPTGSLKTRLEEACRKIQIQIDRLNSTIARLKERDSSIFKKTVSALQRHDTQTASSLSNELAEVRKMAKTASQAKLALEQITLRLSTVQEIGDISATLAPATSIIRSARSGLIGVKPQAENEIARVSSVLSNLLVDVGYQGGLTVNSEAPNEDVEKILDEALKVSEQNTNGKFPKLPFRSSRSEYSKESEQA